MQCSITPYQKKLDKNRIEVGRVCRVVLQIRKSPTPSENRLTVGHPDPIKPQFVPGFESGLLRQNAVALPLALLPQPSLKCVCVPFYVRGQILTNVIFSCFQLLLLQLNFRHPNAAEFFGCRPSSTNSFSNSSSNNNNNSNSLALTPVLGELKPTTTRCVAPVFYLQTQAKRSLVSVVLKCLLIFEANFLLGS